MLTDISKSDQAHQFDLQISNYHDQGTKYLVLSSATKDPFRDNQYRSISIGMLINKQLERRLKFLADEEIKTYEVGVTCERCAIHDCQVRQTPAIHLEKEANNKKIEIIVEELSSKFQA